jgi:manganese-dependent inorganic pyrophosphatase
MVSLFKVSKFLFPAANRLIDSRRVLSSIATLAQTLGGKIIAGEATTQEEDLVLMIGAMGLDSFARRLEDYPREKLLVVVGDRWDIQNLAIRERVRAMIVTGGLEVEQKTIDAANRSHVTLLSSPHDTATTTALCRACIAVRHVIRENFLTLNEEDEIREVQDQAAGSEFLAFPVLDSSGHVTGVLSKSDFLRKIDRKLILVDHNELSQAVKGADQVEILEIIDHHRIGALRTGQPILFRNEPVGSTSTIVADCFFRHGVELPPQIAGLLLAGIVADTLNLTSPTTTQVDKDALVRLEKASGVSARDFTDKLFASGSLLTHKPAPQAITNDCKEYQEENVRFSVAQIEEVGFDQFWPRKNELLEALEQYCAQSRYLFSALLITDVTTQSSLLLIAGNPEFIKRIDYPRAEPGIYELSDIVSRKKQLLPYLTHLLKSSGRKRSR